MTDKMREEFEKWLDKGNHCGCNENMWKAWQACAARMVPEGYVMVPVEPTSDMVCAAIDAGTIDDDDVLWVWGEMLSAAPEVNK